MSEIYKGFELNEYLQSDWYAVENTLVKDILDLLPDKGDTLVDAEHVHAKLVGGDGSPDPALLVDDEGNVIIGTGLAEGLALLHLYTADSGMAAPRAVPTGTMLVLESDGSAYITFAAALGSAIYRGMVFGDEYEIERGSIKYRCVGTTPGAYYDEMYFTLGGLSDYHMMMIEHVSLGSAIALKDALEILGDGDGSGTLRIRAGGAIIDFGIGTVNQVTFSSIVSGDAGSGGELVMHSRSTNTGCKINSSGDLQMDAGQYVRLAQAVETWATNSVVVYGAPMTVCGSWLQFKDSSGVVYWVPATSQDQTAS